MEELLLQAGLDATEASVYLALLELGPSSVTEITNKAHITRTLGYHVLEKLAVFNLVEYAPSSHKKMYSAKHPRFLVQFIKNKKNALERTLKEVDSGIGDLVALYAQADKPELHYQIGIEGVKAICEEALVAKSHIDAIIDLRYYSTEEFREWGRSYDRKRSDLGITERFLLLDSVEARAWMKYYGGSMGNTEFRWLSPDRIPGVSDIGGEVNIFDDSVIIAILKTGRETAVKFDSPVVAGLLRALFELAWQSSTR